GRPPRQVPGDGGGLRAGDDGNRRERTSRAAGGLSPLELIDSPQFPDVEDRHRRPAEEGAALVAEARVREGDVVSADTTKFDRITDKALDALEACLDEHRTDADHLRLRNLQLQAAQTIISNRIKVDDTLLRRQQLDIMPKIIAMLKEEKELLRREDESRLGVA
ncbi:MAG TPA: hypothetical protein VGF35_02575, partial [Steroidobacteraceae bacterium]